MTVSLDNLLKIGQLKAHPPDADEIRRLLDAAARGLKDAGTTSISAETRFDAAYRAIMQSALAALMAHGYRPDTHRPGHHQTVVQALSLTIGLAPTRVTVLDTLRRKRNLADYTGEDIDDASVDACIVEANALLKDVSAWLKSERPALAAGAKRK